MSKSTDLISLLEYTEIVYFNNKANGKLFVSVDGGKTLINPDGKTIPFNDSLFDETDEGELTSAQTKAVTLLTKFDQEKEDRERGDKIVKLDNFVISQRDKDSVETGKIILVGAFGSKYFSIDVSDLDTDSRGFSDEVKKRAEKEVQRRLMVKGNSRTSYTIFSPFYKK
jgi:hypothetical protein